MRGFSPPLTQVDGRVEFPLEILRDARVEREIGFVNDVETSGQAIHHILGAQSDLAELLATAASPRLFVSVE